MKDFFQLTKNLKKDSTALTPIRAAILGDTSTQFLVQALRGAGFEEGMDLQIFEADYDQIERQVFDAHSDLYAYQPDFVIIFKSSHKLLGKYNKLPVAEQEKLAAGELEGIEAIISTMEKQLQARIIFYNYAEINDAVFGSFAGQVSSSFLFQLRKLNFEMMNLAAKRSDLFICDLSSIQNQWGKKTFFQPAVYVNSEMVLSVDVLHMVAYRTLDVIRAILGNIRKCLILDLDNTLWGGVIGDLGMESIQIGELGIGKAFTEFQLWIKKLKERGIILCVCSKNDEKTAKEPFEKHPDMVLKLDDIAVFVANWGNKVDNIRYIQEVLNIGFDSMVFLDDNPFEREMVKLGIPNICVPELPEDPADYLETLYQLNLFETMAVSAADADRTRQYQTESQRAELKKSFENEDEFLQSLNMQSLVEPYNSFNKPRVAQLSQRSNQFNLRTVRYTEADVERLQASVDYFTFSFTLEDKFGDHGLICLIVLKKEDAETLFIENWLMSCRVLKRGMEEFSLDALCRLAGEQGFKYLKGEYIPTAKNGMVEAHYERLGFVQKGDYWILIVNDQEQGNYYIKRK